MAILADHKILLKSQQKNMQKFFKADLNGESFEMWKYDPKKTLWETPLGKFELLAKGTQILFKNEAHILLCISGKSKFLEDEVIRGHFYAIPPKRDSSESESSDPDSESSDSQSSETEYEFSGGFYLTNDKKHLGTHVKRVTKVEMMPISFYYNPKADILFNSEFGKAGWCPVDLLPGCWITKEEKANPPAVAQSETKNDNSKTENDNFEREKTPENLDLFSYFGKKKLFFQFYFFSKYTFIP